MTQMIQYPRSRSRAFLVAMVMSLACTVKAQVTILGVQYNRTSLHELSVHLARRQLPGLLRQRRHRRQRPRLFHEHRRVVSDSQ